MLTQEQHGRMSAMWHARWSGWQGSGVSMAEYARREGFNADAAYRWRRVLRRTGPWVEADEAPASGRAVTIKKRRPAVRFARVAVSDTPPHWAAMLLRVMLRNGRHATGAQGDPATRG